MEDRDKLDIRPTSPEDKPFIRAELRKWWGDEMVVVRGEKFFPAEYGGFIALQGTERIGLILLRFEDNICEIISLSTNTNAPPVGRKLVEAAIQDARQVGVRKMIVVTTNDNIEALRFYQQMGFSICAWRKNAVERSRSIKPHIPLIGNYNIPIMDEIELEIHL